MSEGLAEEPAPEQAGKQPRDLVKTLNLKLGDSEFHLSMGSDLRMLLITIIGGLIVNIVTVVIVGISLALIRMESRMSFPVAMSTEAICAVILIAFFGLCIWAQHRKHNTVFTVSVIAFLSAASAGYLALTLSFIGLAAGVK